MLQGSSGDSLARMCVSKLASFIEDSDQNRRSPPRLHSRPLKCLSVKYIALLALAKIVPSHPHLVAEYQATILTSVNDQDISIRMRALDLVSAMVHIIPKIGAQAHTTQGGPIKRSIHSAASPFPPRHRPLIFKSHHSGTITHAAFHIRLPCIRNPLTITSIPSSPLSAHTDDVLTKHL